jgi:hypothetical protein
LSFLPQFDDQDFVYFHHTYSRTDAPPKFGKLLTITSSPKAESANHECCDPLSVQNFRRLKVRTGQDRSSPDGRPIEGSKLSRDAIDERACTSLDIRFLGPVVHQRGCHCFLAPAARNHQQKLVGECETTMVHRSWHPWTQKLVVDPNRWNIIGKLRVVLLAWKEATPGADLPSLYCSPLEW